MRRLMCKFFNKHTPNISHEGVLDIRCKYCDGKMKWKTKKGSNLI